MILVAGGTGTLGTHIVKLLADERVRVLTRHRDRAVSGAEVTIGDVRGDLSSAVRGCSVVISAVHGFIEGSPETIDRAGNEALIRAACEAGVTRFVLVSVQDARPDHPMSLHRAKYAAEQTLKASGLEWVVVRPTAFLETWIGVMGSNLHKGHALVFGAGTKPVNFVSVRDVAALVARCASDGAIRNETFEIGGMNLAPVELAEKLIAARGRPASIKHIPLPALRVMSVLARPFAPGFARKAGAAVLMNTTDMTFQSPVRERFPDVPHTELSEVL